MLRHSCGINEKILGVKLLCCLSKDALSFQPFSGQRVYVDKTGKDDLDQTIETAFLRGFSGGMDDNPKDNSRRDSEKQESENCLAGCARRWIQNPFMRLMRCLCKCRFYLMAVPRFLGIGHGKGFCLGRCMRSCCSQSARCCPCLRAVLCSCFFLGDDEIPTVRARIPGMDPDDAYGSLPALLGIKWTQQWSILERFRLNAWTEVLRSFCASSHGGGWDLPVRSCVSMYCEPGLVFLGSEHRLVFIRRGVIYKWTVRRYVTVSR